MSLVSALGLSLSFSGRELFHEINFQVEPGERLGLVGPNGSGKTTLLRLLVGQTSPDAGEIRATKGVRIGYLPQDVSEEEVSSHPDPRSGLVLPWQPDTAWFASNLWSRGRPFEACSRTILTRQMERAAKMGFVPQLGMEAEFFVLKDDGNGGYVPVSSRKNLEKPAYDVVRLIDGDHLLSS